MSTRDLLQSFQAWRRSGTPLVLATVVETSGSTYSKPGHRILIAAGGEYQGLVSGGCLENDLALHAQQVLDSGSARVVSYDLGRESDELFGLGVGCDGAIRILLQPLDPGNDYAPFTALAAVLEDHGGGNCAVVTAGPLAGATLVVSDGRSHSHGLDASTARALEHHLGERGALPRVVNIPLSGAGTPVLCAGLAPVPRLLLLGAGPDAVPVVALGHTLGWRITVLDHRPAYLGRPGLAAAELHCTPAGVVPADLSLAHFDAAVLMNHHLASDRSWLGVLAGGATPYIGLLGPRARRERLLRELGTTAASLAGRLHGPAGLAIGADSPESIALAIWAEIEALRTGHGAGGAGVLRPAQAEA